MVKYFEKKVEKKANYMLKHKRLFAYIMMIELFFHIGKLVHLIFKYWDEWHMEAIFKLKKKDTEKDVRGREETESREH